MIESGKPSFKTYSHHRALKNEARLEGLGEAEPAGPLTA